MGYLKKLTKWADTRDDMTVELTNTTLAVWVTIRRDDGYSATGSHAFDMDKAAKSAARLYEVNLI
jgi:hypothetical protein